MTYVLLALGGIAGGLCRYHGARFVQGRFGGDFPLGTGLINLSGSFILGALVGMFARHPSWPTAVLTPLLATGFCGAFTTFSSFAFETIQLWRAGERGRAALNLLGQPVLGGLAAWGGILLGGWL